MSTNRVRFKLKIYGDDPKEVQAAIDTILNTYAPHVTSSPILRSQPTGHHAFVTVYGRPQR